MRDMAFIGLMFLALIYALNKPWAGIMLWTMVSIMNPHKLTWAAADLPVGLATALVVLISIPLSKEKLRFPLNSVTITQIVLILWMGLTTITAANPTFAYATADKVAKIQLMVLLTIAILQSRKHLEMFIWVIVLSIGYYSVKGGVFTLMTGGNFRVWGPMGSFIQDNNALALAVIMTIPLMRYLQMVATSKWVRHGLTVAMVLSAASALGSHSRGALLAIAAMTVLLWWRSERKFLFGSLLVLLGVLLVMFMPGSWEERMGTISTYEQDASAQGRLNAWQMCINVANDRIFGGGFDMYSVEMYALYAPVQGIRLVAHSIYFQMLGEHGYIGLGLFLILWLFGWGTAARLRKTASANPEFKWAGQLAGMCQVSLVGYAVGGAFLSLAYFDLPYDLLAALVIAQRIVTRELETKFEKSRVPAMLSAKPT